MQTLRTFVRQLQNQQKNTQTSTTFHIVGARLFLELKVNHCGCKNEGKWPLQKETATAEHRNSHDHMWVHLDLRQRNKNYAGHINARRITFVGYHMSLKLSSNATQSCILDHMIVIIIFISCYVRFQSLLAQSSHRSFHAWWRHGVRGMKKKKTKQQQRHETKLQLNVLRQYRKKWCIAMNCTATIHWQRRFSALPVAHGNHLHPPWRRRERYSSIRRVQLKQQFMYVWVIVGLLEGGTAQPMAKWNAVPHVSSASQNRVLLSGNTEKQRVHNTPTCDGLQQW